MSLTLDTRTYNNDLPRGTDVFRYHGPDHTSVSNDYVDLGRTKAVPSGDYLGKGRGYVKMVNSQLNALGLPIGDVIFRMEVSVPVGTNETQRDALFDDFVAYLTSTECKNAVFSHDINQ